MNERHKMLSGELYDATDGELVSLRRRARDLLQRLNSSRDAEQELRQELYAGLFGSVGQGIWIEPPFFCDYGANIHLGNRVFLNFNCVILDPAEVHIGSDVLFGPAVQVYTATHPLDWRVRRQWVESARPVVIGSDVWIGGGAILCPGVTIGDRAVIGAGAVVTKDVPPGVLAAGNPSRVIRQLP
jgi:maltose O-acetyltransferase